MPFADGRTMWELGLWGHIRRPGYKASKVDSPKPRKYIHLGLFDWKTGLGGNRHPHGRTVHDREKLKFAAGREVQGHFAHRKTHPPRTLA